MSLNKRPPNARSGDKLDSESITIEGRDLLGVLLVSG